MDGLLSISTLWRTILCTFLIITLSLRKNNPYSELFWSQFFLHFPAFGLNTERYYYLSVFSPNAGKCGKNADQNNSEYGLFLRSVFMLQSFHITLLSHCTFLVLQLFHVASFSCFTFFKLYFFHVKLFHTALFLVSPISSHTLFVLSKSIERSIFNFCIKGRQ